MGYSRSRDRRVHEQVLRASPATASGTGGRSPGRAACDDEGPPVVATLLLGRFHHARRALIRVAQHPRIRYNFAGSVVTESDPKISHGRKRWELDREGWETLLSALAPDRDLAGQKY